MMFKYSISIVAVVTMAGVWLLSGSLVIVVAPRIWGDRDEAWGIVVPFVVGGLILVLVVETIVLAWLVRLAYRQWTRQGEP